MVADTILNWPVLDRIAEKDASIEHRRSLKNPLMRHFLQEVRLFHVQNCCAIEGVTFSLADVESLLSDGLTVGGKHVEEMLRVIGGSRVFNEAVNLSTSPEDIGPDTVIQLHKALTLLYRPDAGMFRARNLRPRGWKKPPDHDQIPAIMTNFFQHLKTQKKNDLVLAGYLNHAMVRLKPCEGADLHLAHAVTNTFLMKRGYLPYFPDSKERTKYIRYLKLADEGTLAPLVNLLAKYVDGSYSRYISMLEGEQELIPLSELAEDSPYSQEYLSLRARQGILDAVKLGRTWHSTKRSLEEYIEEYGR